MSCIFITLKVNEWEEAMDEASSSSWTLALTLQHVFFYYLDNAVWHLITQLLSKSGLPAFQLSHFFSQKKVEGSESRRRDLFSSCFLPINVIKEFIVKLDTQPERFSHKKSSHQTTITIKLQEPKLSAMMNQQISPPQLSLIVSQVLISRK